MLLLLLQVGLQVVRLRQNTLQLLHAAGVGGGLVATREGGGQRRGLGLAGGPAPPLPPSTRDH